MMLVRRLSVGLFLAAVVAWPSTQICAQVAVPADVLQIPLFDGFDNFGNQFQTIQIYGEGDTAAPAFGIYDTGASVVTLSVADRESFASQNYNIPILPGGVASATAVGGSGTLTGDVSQPGLVTALPYSAFSFETGKINMSGGIAVPGIQMFVGNQSGSPVLPTITGTPIHAPSGIAGSFNEFGVAAKIEMFAGEMDLGSIFAGMLPEFDGLMLSIPEISFVQPGSTLTPNASTYYAVDIPVRLYGESTVSNPGNAPTVGFNPVVDSTAVFHNNTTIGEKTFLFDTGAQLSIISTEMALGLGLDLNNPTDEIAVQGASGIVSVPGFTIEKLMLPRTDGGIIEFNNVPIYVLDIGEGLDGILGMNLFNGADGILYDPTLVDPTVSVTFLANRDIADDVAAAGDFADFEADMNALFAELSDLFGEEVAEAAFGDTFSVFSLSMGTSRFGTQGPFFIGVNPVPEPNSAILASFGLAMLASWRRRGLRRRVV